MARAWVIYNNIEIKEVWNVKIAWVLFSIQDVWEYIYVKAIWWYSPCQIDYLAFGEMSKVKYDDDIHSLTIDSW